MLDFLITSDTRRGLLTLLWGEGERGSVSALARRTGVTPAAARTELRAMRRLGLAREVRTAGARYYEAASDHPHARTLRALARLPVTAEPHDTSADTEADDANLRGALSAYGARLKGYRTVVRTDLPLERALAAGCALAHRDPAVARVMPRLLYRYHRDLDWDRFTAALQDAGAKHTAGFLLAVASNLFNATALTRMAESLRDGRRKKVQPFFAPTATGKLPGRKKPTTGNLPVAEAWAFWFPLPLADFPKR